MTCYKTVTSDVMAMKNQDFIDSNQKVRSRGDPTKMRFAGLSPQRLLVDNTKVPIWRWLPQQ